MDFYIFLRTVIVLLFSLSFCHFYKKLADKKASRLLQQMAHG